MAYIINELRSNYYTYAQSLRPALKYHRDELIRDFLAAEEGVTRPVEKYLVPENYAACQGIRMMIPSRHGDHEIPVYLYMPEKKAEKMPVFFIIHGGGWCVGCPEMYDKDGIRIRDELNCVAVNIGYRLAPEAPFPAGLYDNYDVVDYFVEHAAEYNIDVDRMVAVGDSSGGNLALTTTFMAVEQKKFKFKAQILFYPVTDASEFPLDVPNAIDELAIRPDRMLQFYGCYCTYDELKDPHVSPVYIPERYLREMPATILFTAELDALRDQGERMGRLLFENGVPVVIKRYQNMPHGFTPHGFSLEAQGDVESATSESWEIALGHVKAFLEMQ